MAGTHGLSDSQALDAEALILDIGVGLLLGRHRAGDVFLSACFRFIPIIGYRQ